MGSEYLTCYEIILTLGVLIVLKKKKKSKVKTFDKRTLVNMKPPSKTLFFLIRLICVLTFKQKKLFFWIE